MISLPRSIPALLLGATLSTPALAQRTARPDADDASPDAGSKLELHAREGQDLVFLVETARATEPRDAGRPATRDAERSEGPPGRAAGKKASARRCRLTVQDVSEKGEITLLVDLGGTPPTKGSTPPEESSRERGARKGKDAADGASHATDDLGTRLVKLGPDGRLRPARGKPPIPEDLEDPCRFIFASGLQGTDLETGKTYSLAALYAKDEAGDETETRSRPFRFRYERMRKKGSETLLHFSVLRPRPSGKPVAPGPGGTASSGASDGGSDKSRHAGADTGDPAPRETWHEVGEAVYRKSDGLLDRATLRGGLPTSTDRGDPEDAGDAAFRIRRIASGR